MSSTPHGERAEGLVPVDRSAETERVDASASDGDADGSDLALMPPGAGARPVTATWSLDLSSNAIWWSPELYDVLGVEVTFPFSLESVSEMLQSGTTGAVRATIDRWLERPLPFERHCRIIGPDGEPRVLELRGMVGLDGDPRPRRMVGTCRDVTADREHERERLRLARQKAMILRAAGDGICGLDVAGRISFCNPALRTLMRRDGEDLVGRSLHELVHLDADGRPLHALAECPFRSSREARTRATDPEFHRADGSRIEVAYVRVAVEEDAWEGAVLSFRDTTAGRAASRLLQTSLQQVHALSAQRGALLRHLAEAEERERLRIAADIHDDTIQALGAVALRLSRAGERAADDHDRELLADAEIEVRGVAERLRRLMFDLMPPIAGRDLRTAVESYCAIVFADTPIAYEIVGEVQELSPERYLVAYRLIQEALRNALAHSRGTRVEVRFEQVASELRLRVSDDGIGLGEGETPLTHAGLRIVRRRIEAAGGSAHFGVGLDGRGTSIELRLPSRWSEER